MIYEPWKIAQGIHTCWSFAPGGNVWELFPFFFLNRNLINIQQYVRARQKQVTFASCSHKHFCKDVIFSPIQILTIMNKCTTIKPCTSETSWNIEWLIFFVFYATVIPVIGYIIMASFIFSSKLEFSKRTCHMRRSNSPQCWQ